MRNFYAYTLVAVVCFYSTGCGKLNLRPSLDFPSSEEDYLNVGEEHSGLQVVFFGTSTILLSDKNHSILIDGFFSRPSWWQLLFTKIKPNQEEISFSLSKAKISKVDAIFVAHSHHDHAMDSGIVAQRTGATLYGSESTLNIARGQSTPEHQLHLLDFREKIKVGDFQVSIFKTPHSRKPINSGLIKAPLHTPTRLSNYKMAENFSFYIDHPLGKILVAPSANFEPRALGGVNADVVFLGIGVLSKQTEEFTNSYWGEVVKNTGARFVFPVHWDDFTISLKKPLVPFPFFIDDMDLTVRRLQRLSESDGVTIRFIPALKTIHLPMLNFRGSQ